jgi:hypothetical protein
MSMRKWTGGVVVMAMLAAGTTASAQFGNQENNPRPDARHGYQIDTNNSALLIFPDLRTAPAPDWVKPGLRLSYYSASATIPQSYVGGLVQDPDGKWVDPKTGKSYRMEGAASASGHGYSQLDVISLTDDAVVLDLRALGIEGVDGPVRPISASGLTTLPGAAADWWVNPDVLNQTVDNLNGSGMRSVRTTYKAAGQDFDAVWVSTQTGNGSISYVIDLTGGMLLHNATCTSSGPTGTTNLNGVPTNVGGSTSLGQTTFVGMRQIHTPWERSPMPRSLNGVRQLVYDGQTRMTVEGVSADIPMRAIVEITGRGPDFIQFKKTVKTDTRGSIMQQPDAVSSCVSGMHQLLPLCIPPQSLGQLRNGQVLDKDPVTKVNTFVSFIGQDTSGNNVVTLTEFIADNATRTDYVYEAASGILCAVQMTDPTLHTQTTLYRVR